MRINYGDTESAVWQADTLIGWGKRTIDDYVTSDYKRKIADGQIINNPVAYQKHTYEHHGGALWEEQHNTSPYWFKFHDGNITQWKAGGTNLYDTEPQELQDLKTGASIELAKQKALRFINASDYGFGEDVGEIRETFKFLRSPFTSMIKVAVDFRKMVLRRHKTHLNLVRDLRVKMRRAKSLKKREYYRRRLRKAEKSLKFHITLAGAWAEYFWAFQPLLRSAEDALTILGDLGTGLDLEKTAPRFSARGFSDGEAAHAVDRIVGNPPPDTGQNISYTKTLWEEYHAHILYSLTNPVRDWRKLLGLRFRDLPVTIWQVTPLSFMVDRVVNISSMIEGVTNLADPSVEILAASVRTKREQTLKAQLNNAWRYGYTTVNADGGLVEDTIFSYNRQVWHPSLSDTLPKIEISGLVDDAFKIIDLAAVLVSRLRF